MNVLGLALAFLGFGFPQQWNEKPTATAKAALYFATHSKQKGFLRIAINGSQASLAYEDLENLPWNDNTRFEKGVLLVTERDAKRRYKFDTYMVNSVDSVDGTKVAEFLVVCPIALNFRSDADRVERRSQTYESLPIRTEGVSDLTGWTGGFEGPCRVERIEISKE